MILNAGLKLESHCLSWVSEEEGQIDNIGMMGNPGHLSSTIQISDVFWDSSWHSLCGKSWKVATV